MKENEDWIITEMRIVREYCALIHKERQKNGFQSLKYPLNAVSLNRWFLPEFKRIIAQECNIYWYMDLDPIDFNPDQEVPVIIDTSRSEWQDKLYEKRLKKSEDAKLRKQMAM